MSCCGRRDAATAVLGGGADASQGSAVTAVQYLGATTIVVRGPMTGRRYTFSLAAPAQPVDARDAAAILRSSRFRAL